VGRGGFDPHPPRQERGALPLELPAQGPDCSKPACPMCCAAEQPRQTTAGFGSGCEPGWPEHWAAGSPSGQHQEGKRGGARRGCPLVVTSYHCFGSMPT
jgi:hypothetical protein